MTNTYTPSLLTGVGARLTELLTTAAMPAFDYGTLDEGIREAVCASANEIRRQVSAARHSIITVGTRLIEVKEILPHGLWSAWLKAEFEWSERTAQRYMRVATVFGSKPDTVSDLPPGVLQVLAAPSTPPDVREEVLREVAQAGAAPTVNSVKRRAALARASGQTAALEERRQRASNVLAAVADTKAERAEVAVALIVKELGEERTREILETVKEVPPAVLGAALLKVVARAVGEITLD